MLKLVAALLFACTLSACASGKSLNFACDRFKQFRHRLFQNFSGKV